MYKLKIVMRAGGEVIRSRDKGNRTLVLRTFAEARMFADNGAKVKITVRAPDGRVTKHTFKGKGYEQ